MAKDFLPDLLWRNLLHQCTDAQGLASHLSSGSRRVYVGFDPTADSLTIGNLVPIMMLAHAQRAGHTPVVVMGGGTGLIGDPSGKTDERQLRTRDEIAANVESQKRIFRRMLDFSPSLHNRAILADNADWLTSLTFIEALRDIGKHFSVNMMIQKDSVRERLHAREQGISYTEFSYMILQAYDFAHLQRAFGVSVQMGGSDQWGNIVAGADLIRRMSAAASGTHDGLPCFGLTAPLVTKSDGGKFGKTESGAIWLTAERTSAYTFHQFWLNTPDADVGRYLRLFTFMDHARIAELEEQTKTDPGARAAQRALADEATDLLHGRVEREQAQAAARALFGGDLAALSERTLLEALGAAPKSSHDRALLDQGVPLVEVLAATTLAKSRSEARTLLSQGSISCNGRPVTPETVLRSSDLLHRRLIALRRGKKAWHLTEWA